MNKIWLSWSNNYDTVWGNNNYIWSEVYILEKATSGGSGGGGLLLKKNQPWKSLEKELDKKKFTREEKKKLLEIVVRVNGLEIHDSREIEETKKMITVEHIRKTIADFNPTVKVSAVDVKKS